MGVNGSWFIVTSNELSTHMSEGWTGKAKDSMNTFLKLLVSEVGRRTWENGEDGRAETITVDIGKPLQMWGIGGAGLASLCDHVLVMQRYFEFFSDNTCRGREEGPFHITSKRFQGDV